MYICLCVCILICTSVYGIAILAPKINLISVMGDYKSFQNNFPNEITSHYHQTCLTIGS